MKKMIVILAGILFAACQAGMCDSVGDQFVTGLFQHSETVVETTTKGETYGELLVTPVQLGKIDGGYLVGIDGGVLGNVAPSSANESGMNWTFGVHAHLSPFIKNLVGVNVPAAYPAIAGFEINPRISLDRSEDAQGKKHYTAVYGIAAGWAWGGTPQQ